jgi:hypothetical protein
MLMLFLRAQQIKPSTEVAEYRENWQCPVHPQDLFINFDQLVMADRRVLEVPNRVYMDIDATLQVKDTPDGGSFAGDMLQETQPVARKIPAHPAFSAARMGMTAIGQLLLVVAAFLVFRFTISVATGMNLDQPEASLYLIGDNINTLIAALIFWVFGSNMSNYAHAFWAEMQFDSLLVFFQCQGTYRKGRIVTGKSQLHEGISTENTSVTSSPTFWILAARATSSIFAASGPKNLEFPRLLLETKPAPSELGEIVEDIRTFVSERKGTVILNEGDAEEMRKINRINQEAQVALGSPMQSAGLLSGDATQQDQAAAAKLAVVGATQSRGQE